MKKILALLLCLAVTIHFAQARTLRLGICGGGTFPMEPLHRLCHAWDRLYFKTIMSTAMSEEDADKVSKLKARKPLVLESVERIFWKASPDQAVPAIGGGCIGGFARLQFSTWHFHSEMLFSVFPFNHQAEKSEDAKFNVVLDIPLAAGTSLSGVRVHVGPIFRCLLYTTTAIREWQDRTSVYYNLGGQAGFGIDLWDVSLDLRFNSFFYDSEKREIDLVTCLAYYPWVFSVGYNLLESSLP